nr:LytTR family DNA-binding domain-containing protein [uncultured Allomuricauda sp.]
MDLEISVLILKKSYLNYQVLMEELEVEKFIQCKVVYSFEEAQAEMKDDDYDVILVDIEFIESVNNDDDSFCFHRDNLSKWIWYSSRRKRVTAPDGSTVLESKNFFLRPYDDLRNEEYKDSIVGLLEGDNKREVLNQDDENRGKMERVTDSDSFFVKSKSSLKRVKFEDILCFESERNYITIFLEGEKYVIRRTLQSLMEILPDNFVRINRSIIVNLEKIDKIVGNRVFIRGMKGNVPLMSSKHKTRIFDTIPLF